MVWRKGEEIRAPANGEQERIAGRHVVRGRRERVEQLSGAREEVRGPRARRPQARSGTPAATRLCLARTRLRRCVWFNGHRDGTPREEPSSSAGDDRAERPLDLHVALLQTPGFGRRTVGGKKRIVFPLLPERISGRARLSGYCPLADCYASFGGARPEAPLAGFGLRRRGDHGPQRASCREISRFSHFECCFREISGMPRKNAFENQSVALRAIHWQKGPPCL